MNKEELDKIIQKVKEAREDYYNLNPKISDEEYDLLVEIIKKEKPDEKEVLKVGAEVPKNSVWNKIKHDMVMGSLNKVVTFEELNEWRDKYHIKEMFMTHKIDGSSLEIVYEDGVLKSGITRGDGVVGEDITENIVNIPNIPKTIKVMGKVNIRGEVVMTKKVFKDHYSDEYANPRNTANGKVREKKNGGKDCLNLRFIAYNMLIDGMFYEGTMSGLILNLKGLGFEIPHFFIIANNTEDLKKKYDNYLKGEDIEYEIDGLVVSCEDLKLLNELGDENMRPLGQIAWKFPSTMKSSKITGIQWQIGPSGRITPVAKIEPVEIEGVKITSVSLHNMNIFNELNLHLNDEVLISRRNQVIPYVEKNLSR